MLNWDDPIAQFKDEKLQEKSVLLNDTKIKDTTPQSADNTTSLEGEKHEGTLKGAAATLTGLEEVQFGAERLAVDDKK